MSMSCMQPSRKAHLAQPTPRVCGKRRAAVCWKWREASLSCMRRYSILQIPQIFDRFCRAHLFRLHQPLFQSDRQHEETTTLKRCPNFNIDSVCPVESTPSTLYPVKSMSKLRSSTTPGAAGSEAKVLSHAVKCVYSIQPLFSYCSCANFGSFCFLFGSKMGMSCLIAGSKYGALVRSYIKDRPLSRNKFIIAA